MGQSNSARARLDPQLWAQKAPEELTGSLPVHPNPYSKRILVHQHTDQCLQEYEMAFPTRQQLLEYERQALLRQQTPVRYEAEQGGQNSLGSCPYLYPLCYFLDDSTQSLCNTSHRALVYAQKYALRLTDLQVIPFPDQLYLLEATFQGFKVLYQKVGFFDIMEQMVFLDERGRARVWMHPNISASRPFYLQNQHKRQSAGSQSQMIVNLISIIEDHDDPDHSRQSRFSQYLRSKGTLGKMSFHRALNELKLFCLEQRVNIPHCMRCVAQLFSDEYDSQNSSQFNKSSVVEFERKRKYSRLLTPRTPHSSIEKVERRAASPIQWHNIELEKSRVSQKSYHSSGSNKNRQSKGHLFGDSHQSKFLSNRFPFCNNLTRVGSNQAPAFFSKAHEPVSGIPITVTTPIDEIARKLQSKDNFPESPPVEAVPKPILNASKRGALRAQRVPPIVVPIQRQESESPSPGRLAMMHKDSGSENARTNANQLNSNPSESVFSFREDSVFQNRLGRVSYYTPTDEHHLDDEIAQDLERFLGFNPSQP